LPNSTLVRKETLQFQSDERRIAMKRATFLLAAGIFLVFCLLFLSLGMGLRTAYADIDTGLVAYWAFDDGSGGTAKDSAGTNDGTLAGDPQWVAGYLNGALQFDGADDYVRAAHIPFDNQTFTIAMWVNPVLYTAEQIIFSQTQSSTTNLDMHFRLGGPGSASGNVPEGGARMGFYSNDLDTAGGIIEDNNWYHLTFWYDFENGDRRIYINGVQAAQAAATPYLGASGDTLIGSWWGTSQWFRGIIDEVRVYHRALTADDITELFNWSGGTKAKAGPDVWMYGNEQGTLDGSKSSSATTFAWSQVKKPGDPDITITNPNQATATFTPPGTQIGYILTFNLTVTGETGTDDDEVQYFVRAINVPKVAPSNVKIHPVDQGATLGFRLLWDPLIDAEKYQGALKLGTQYFWLYNTTNAYMDFTGGAEGVEQTVAVRGENKFSILGSPDPSKHGLQSADVTYKVMRNLALPASLQGGYPPASYVTKVSPSGGGAGLNNLVVEDNVNSSGTPKLEDYWGYLWDQPKYFDRIVYYTGQFGAGGWFTSLKVQYTQDGTNWIDVPGAQIVPPYDFTDSAAGRTRYSRYDIYIPTVRGTGIRIYGTPGGLDQYTSVGELEIYGDETRPEQFLLVQGVDATYPEAGTATLDGSYSFSTRGPITSWKWEKVSGPDVTINNSTSARATFTAPIVSSDTQMVFKLTAGDGTETLSDSDVRIAIKNLITTSVAGADQRVMEGTAVTLDGSGSMSTTGTLSYLWTQTAGTPAGVTGSTAKTVNFTAPVLWGFTDDLKFKLDVNDGSGTSSDEVVVTVYNVAGLVSPLGPGFFQDVLHLGTDADDRFTAPLGVNNDQLITFGGQAKVNPRPAELYDFTGTNVTVTTNPAVWTPLHSASGWYGTGDALEYFIQYYHIYIISPENRDVRWHFYHDDPVRLWNNGVLALSRDGAGGEFVRFGSAAQGRGLNKGLNSITFKFEEIAGGNYVAIGATDLAGNEFTDLQYSLGLPMGIADAYAARKLPDWYEPNGTVDVSLSFRVNPANTPGSVSIREVIPPGIPMANITAPGATVTPSGIVWTLTGNQVKTSTITYSMTIPEDMTQGLDFAGTVSFGTTSADIIGEDIVYAVPTEPLYLVVEMLMGAHLSWAAPATEGTASYNVFRSVNGGTWTLIGSTSAASFVDSLATAGNNYSYAVSAVGVNGMEGPQSSPTPQAQLPAAGTFQTREAEDFNYNGGQFPWTSAVTVTALESPSATEIGTPQQYDYYHPATGGPAAAGRSYRPLDNRNDQPDPADANSGTGVAIETVLDDGTTDVYHTNIGWINAGSWYRYGFNVTQTGWVKLTFRVAAPDPATIAAYWDEELIGTASFDTNSWHTLTWVTMEQFEETDTGVHHLRVALLSGGYNFDKIAIGFNWTPPKRETIWSDNFDSYTSDANVKAGGWTIENGSGYPDAAWRLWDTEGPMLNNQDPNLAGMYDKYMISDSDLAPDADLDERLVSKEVDCSNHIKVRLNFTKNYNAYEDPDHLQVAEVDIRVFDNGVWGNWVNLGHWDRDTGSSSTPEQMDIASLADKKKIQVRWHFFGATWDYWFAIDQVRVSGEPLPTEAKITKLTPAAGKLTLIWTVFGTKQYTVQQTDNLVGGPWVSAPGTWPISAQTWTSGDLSGTKKLFYRVMGQ
jgi:hypothetical protein